MQNQQILMKKTTPNFAMPKTPMKSITPLKYIFPLSFQLCKLLQHVAHVQTFHLVISTVTLLTQQDKLEQTGKKYLPK